MTVSTGVEFWGPSAWKFLHAVTFCVSDTPDEEEVQHLQAFFHSLGYLLPCPKCGTHYRNYMATHSQSFEVAVRSGPLIQRFMYDLHAEVTTRTGGTALSYADVEHMYRHGHRPGTPPPLSLAEWADPHFGSLGAATGPQESPVHFVALAIATAVLLREGSRLWAATKTTARP